MDIAVAKITVRELIARGVRQGPSNLLILPDLVQAEWYELEAVKFLQENKARSQGYAKGNEGSLVRSEDEGARGLGESLRSLPGVDEAVIRDR